MTKAAFEKLLERYLRGTCSPAESRLVQQWYDQLADESSLNLSDAEKADLRTRMLARIQARLANQEAEVPVLPLRAPSRRWLGWAAAALLLLSGSWFWLSGHLTRFTPDQPQAIVLTGRKAPRQIYHAAGRPQNVRLADGSQITLMPGSSLFVSNRFGLRRREVELQGNAYFDIARQPEKPFLVYCGQTVTQVLGTSFWINSHKQENTIEVTVRSGRVTVFEHTGKDRSSLPQTKVKRNGVVLKPNQKVVFYPRNHHLITGLVDKPRLLLPPQRTLFNFVDTPLPQVFDSLEKGYGIDIIVSDEKVEKCTFSGDLADLSLDDKLKLVCESVNASYEVRGTHILILGSGCP